MTEFDTSPTHIDGLGPGWEPVEAALAAVQADLSRTVPDSPMLLLLWRDDPTTDERRAYVGKARDWYYGMGGVELTRDYTEMVLAIADDVSDAVVDTLLGYYGYWPHCPVDDKLMYSDVEPDGRCVWACDERERHIVAEIGQLGLS